MNWKIVAEELKYTEEEWLFIPKSHNLKILIRNEKRRIFLIFWIFYTRCIIAKNILGS